MTPRTRDKGRDADNSPARKDAPLSKPSFSRTLVKKEQVFARPPGGTTFQA